MAVNVDFRRQGRLLGHTTEESSRRNVGAAVCYAAASAKEAYAESQKPLVRNAHIPLFAS